MYLFGLHSKNARICSIMQNVSELNFFHWYYLLSHIWRNLSRIFFEQEFHIPCCMFVFCGQWSLDQWHLVALWTRGWRVMSWVQCFEL